MPGKLLHFALSSLAVITTIAAPAHAQGNVRGIIRLGGDFGGDKVLQFTYADGSTPTITAGGGMLLSGGAALQLLGSAEQALDLQGTVGVKYRTIPPASNQNATWARFPVEGLLMYRAPFGMRIGGGAAVHLGNVLEASGAAANNRVEFKPSPGYVTQAEYALGHWSFDLRYTLMKYEVSSGGTGTVSANSLGAGLSYALGGSTSRAVKTH
jgi:hypothetical protein